MQITVKGKQIDLTDSLKNYASEKMSKMSRYFDHMISAEICLSIERNWHVAEITVFGEGFDMRGEEKSTDMYNSIDRVVEKLERQLKKQKGKHERRRSARGPAAPPTPAYNSADSSNSKREKKGGTATMEEESLYAPRVDHVHTFFARSLSIEMAIKEMEEAGHEFYAFYNEDKRRINVVFKKDKGYGLLDPRLED
ncbi:MAG: ribosome-associated translation inhibitor RaiA [Candidatus Eremiobacteraeota bacterium]|nr:ribosome-associated translation inhibitor RaiA [Candidatus Eremiobacteraeota bacterium]